jgi:tight adherence protein B
MLLYAVLPAVILLLGALIITSAFVLVPNTGAEIERRIGLVAAPASGKSSGQAAGAAKKRKGPTFTGRVRKAFAVGAARTWGMHAGALNLLLISAICGLGVFHFLSRAVALPWWIAVAFGILAAFMVPRAILLKQQRSAENRFMDLFPDAIDTIVRMLRAGLPMTSAVRVAGDECAPPVNAAFAMIADQVKIGIPIEQALEASSKQIGLSDFRFFAVAVLLQYSAGGNIAATLDMLSGIMRKRRAVRMKAKSATAEIRLTGYLLGSLPFVTIGILLLIQPRYLDPLFADRRGHVILAMAVGGLALSFFTMRQMMRSVTKG